MKGIREKLIDILKTYNYKIYEKIDLKGRSGLSYAVDIYAIREDPFSSTKIVFMIPEQVITKDLILDLKIIYSDVPDIDQIVVVCTKGIDKEAYTLAESGEKIILMDEQAVERLHQRKGKKVKEEEFEIYTLKLSVLDKDAREILKNTLYGKKWFTSHLIDLELMYRPFYLVYVAVKLHNKITFTGIMIDGITGEVSKEHSELAVKVPILMKKKIYSVSTIPYEVIDFKVPEDKIEKIVELWFDTNEFEIFQIQKIYVPIWVAELDARGKKFRIEICGTTGQVLTEIPENKDPVNKVLYYIYNPDKIVELLFKK